MSYSLKGLYQVGIAFTEGESGLTLVLLFVGMDIVFGDFSLEGLVIVKPIYTALLSLECRESIWTIN